MAAPYARLLYVQISGGYLDGLDFELAPHTSCIIGGKGSGKTSIFELIRFSFGNRSLVARDRVPSVVKTNLGPGTVRVGFETKHGVRYVVERTLADAAPRFLTPDGPPVKVSPDFFHIEAYSQDEIEAVGEDRSSQLALIDRFAVDRLKELGAEIDAVSTALEESRKTLLEVEAAILALENDAGEARTIEEQLRPLLAGAGQDAGPLAKAREAKGLRGRERQVMASAAVALTDVRTTVLTALSSAKRTLATAIPPELRAGANAEVFALLATELADVGGELEGASTRLGKRIEAASTVFGAQRDALAARHAEQDVAYDALQAVQNEEQERKDERARLQERHAVVAGAIAALEERTKLRARLREERSRLVLRLFELRDARSGVRAGVRDTLNTQLERDGVRVRVEQDENLDAYRGLLREALLELTNGQPKWLVDRIAPNVRPDELVAMVRAQDTARLITKAKLQKNPERAAQVIAALTPSSRLYALEAVAIDDVVAIELLHGAVWKDTIVCSPGQRSGAILPILLLQTEWPLLIDQPDDNVDPDFMCNSILPRVVALRGVRQFVFVTHHANVPVLASAEQIVHIASDGAHASLSATGDVVHMKEWIVMKLEGGEAAFEARQRAYRE